MNSFEMPSGAQKEEKLGWKNRSGENKGTREVNGFFLQR